MNSEQQEKHQPDVGKVSLGKRLKSAREELELSVQDVADSLRLRVSVIEEIEEDQFNETQLPTFTRGYIRGYAKLVGVNTAELLLKESPLAAEAQPEPSMISFSQKTRLQKNDNQLMTLTWAILTILVGITVIWGMQSREDEQLDNLQVEMKTVNVETAATNTDNIATDSMATVVVTPLTTPSAVANNSQANVSEDKPVEPKPNAEPQPPLPVAKMLSMDFIADCWIDIRDGNGKRLMTGIKSRGESVNLDGKEPFKIVLGAPSAVKLSFKGQAIDLSNYPPKRVARLTLPKK